MDTSHLDEVIMRLERLSADSIHAHHASGVRRSLVRAQENLTAGEPLPDGLLEDLLAQAYALLEAAAREIPDEDRPER